MASQKPKRGKTSSRAPSPEPAPAQNKSVKKKTVTEDVVEDGSESSSGSSSEETSRKAALLEQLVQLLGNSGKKKKKHSKEKHKKDDENVKKRKRGDKSGETSTTTVESKPPAKKKAKTEKPVDAEVVPDTDGDNANSQGEEAEDEETEPASKQLQVEEEVDITEEPAPTKPKKQKDVPKQKVQTPKTDKDKQRSVGKKGSKKSPPKDSKTSPSGDSDKKEQTLEEFLVEFPAIIPPELGGNNSILTVAGLLNQFTSFCQVSVLVKRLFASATSQFTPFSDRRMFVEVSSGKVRQHLTPTQACSLLGYLRTYPKALRAINGDDADNVPDSSKVTNVSGVIDGRIRGDEGALDLQLLLRSFDSNYFSSFLDGLLLDGSVRDAESLGTTIIASRFKTLAAFTRDQPLNTCIFKPHAHVLERLFLANPFVISSLMEMFLSPQNKQLLLEHYKKYKVAVIGIKNLQPPIISERTYLAALLGFLRFVDNKDSSILRFIEHRTHNTFCKSIFGTVAKCFGTIIETTFAGLYPGTLVGSPLVMTFSRRDREMESFLKLTTGDFFAGNSLLDNKKTSKPKSKKIKAFVGQTPFWSLARFYKTYSALDVLSKKKTSKEDIVFKMELIYRFPFMFHSVLPHILAYVQPKLSLVLLAPYTLNDIISYKPTTTTTNNEQRFATVETACHLLASAIMEQLIATEHGFTKYKNKYNKVPPESSAQATVQRAKIVDHMLKDVHERIIEDSRKLEHEIGDIPVEAVPLWFHKLWHPNTTTAGDPTSAAGSQPGSAKKTPKGTASGTPSSEKDPAERTNLDEDAKHNLMLLLSRQSAMILMAINNETKNLKESTTAANNQENVIILKRTNVVVQTTLKILSKMMEGTIEKLAAEREEVKLKSVKEQAQRSAEAAKQSSSSSASPSATSSIPSKGINFTPSAVRSNRIMSTNSFFSSCINSQAVNNLMVSILLANPVEQNSKTSTTSTDEKPTESPTRLVNPTQATWCFICETPTSLILETKESQQTGTGSSAKNSRKKKGHQTRLELSSVLYPNYGIQESPDSEDENTIKDKTDTSPLAKIRSRNLMFGLNVIDATQTGVSLDNLIYVAKTPSEKGTNIIFETKLVKLPNRDGSVRRLSTLSTNNRGADVKTRLCARPMRVFDIRLIMEHYLCESRCLYNIYDRFLNNISFSDYATQCEHSRLISHNQKATSRSEELLKRRRALINMCFFSFSEFKSHLEQFVSWIRLGPPTPPKGGSSSKPKKKVDTKKEKENNEGGPDQELLDGSRRVWDILEKMGYKEIALWTLNPPLSSEPTEEQDGSFTDRSNRSECDAWFTYLYIEFTCGLCCFSDQTLEEEEKTKQEEDSEENFLNKETIFFSPIPDELWDICMPENAKKRISIYDERSGGTEDDNHSTSDPKEVTDEPDMDTEIDIPISSQEKKTTLPNKVRKSYKKKKSNDGNEDLITPHNLLDFFPPESGSAADMYGLEQLTTLEYLTYAGLYAHAFLSNVYKNPHPQNMVLELLSQNAGLDEFSSIRKPNQTAPAGKGTTATKPNPSKSFSQNNRDNPFPQFDIKFFSKFIPDAMVSDNHGFKSSDIPTGPGWSRAQSASLSFNPNIVAFPFTGSLVRSSFSETQQVENNFSEFFKLWREQSANPNQEKTPQKSSSASSSSSTTTTTTTSTTQVANLPSHVETSFGNIPKEVLKYFFLWVPSRSAIDLQTESHNCLVEQRTTGITQAVKFLANSLITHSCSMGLLKITRSVNEMLEFFHAFEEFKLPADQAIQETNKKSKSGKSKKRGAGPKRKKSRTSETTEGEEEEAEEEEENNPEESENDDIEDQPNEENANTDEPSLPVIEPKGLFYSHVSNMELGLMNRSGILFNKRSGKNRSSKDGSNLVQTFSPTIVVEPKYRPTKPDPTNMCPEYVVPILKIAVLGSNVSNTSPGYGLGKAEQVIMEKPIVGSKPVVGSSYLPPSNLFLMDRMLYLYSNIVKRYDNTPLNIEEMAKKGIDDASEDTEEKEEQEDKEEKIHKKPTTTTTKDSKPKSVHFEDDKKVEAKPKQQKKSQNGDKEKDRNVSQEEGEEGWLPEIFDDEKTLEPSNVDPDGDVEMDKEDKDTELQHLMDDMTYISPETQGEDGDMDPLISKTFENTLDDALEIDAVEEEKKETDVPTKKNKSDSKSSSKTQVSQKTEAKDPKKEEPAKKGASQKSTEKEKKKKNDQNSSVKITGSSMETDTDSVDTITISSLVKPPILLKASDFLSELGNEVSFSVASYSAREKVNSDIICKSCTPIRFSNSSFVVSSSSIIEKDDLRKLVRKGKRFDSNEISVAKAIHDGILSRMRFVASSKDPTSPKTFYIGNDGSMVLFPDSDLNPFYVTPNEVPKTKDGDIATSSTVRGTKRVHYIVNRATLALCQSLRHKTDKPLPPLFWWNKNNALSNNKPQSSSSYFFEFKTGSHHFIPLRLKSFEDLKSVSSNPSSFGLNFTACLTNMISKFSALRSEIGDRLCKSCGLGSDNQSSTTGDLRHKIVREKSATDHQEFLGLLVDSMNSGDSSFKNTVFQNPGISDERNNGFREQPSLLMFLSENDNVDQLFCKYFAMTGQQSSSQNNAPQKNDGYKFLREFLPTTAPSPSILISRLFKHFFISQGMEKHAERLGADDLFTTAAACSILASVFFNVDTVPFQSSLQKYEQEQTSGTKKFEGPIAVDFDLFKSNITKNGTSTTSAATETDELQKTIWDDSKGLDFYYNIPEDVSDGAPGILGKNLKLFTGKFSAYLNFAAATKETKSFYGKGHTADSFVFIIRMAIIYHSFQQYVKSFEPMFSEIMESLRESLAFPNRGDKQDNHIKRTVMQALIQEKSLNWMTFNKVTSSVSVYQTCPLSGTPSITNNGGKNQDNSKIHTSLAYNVVCMDTEDAMFGIPLAEDVQVINPRTDLLPREGLDAESIIEEQKEKLEKALKLDVPDKEEGERSGPPLAHLNTKDMLEKLLYEDLEGDSKFSKLLMSTNTTPHTLNAFIGYQRCELITKFIHKVLSLSLYSIARSVFVSDPANNFSWEKPMDSMVQMVKKDLHKGSEVDIHWLWIIRIITMLKSLSLKFFDIGEKVKNEEQEEEEESEESVEPKKEAVIQKKTKKDDTDSTKKNSSEPVSVVPKNKTPVTIEIKKNVHQKAFEDDEDEEDAKESSTSDSSE